MLTLQSEASVTLTPQPYPFPRSPTPQQPVIPSPTPTVAEPYPFATPTPWFRHPTLTPSAVPPTHTPTPIPTPPIILPPTATATAPPDTVSAEDFLPRGAELLAEQVVDFDHDGAQELVLLYRFPMGTPLFIAQGEGGDLHLAVRSLGTSRYLSRQEPLINDRVILTVEDINGDGHDELLTRPSTAGGYLFTRVGLAAWPRIYRWKDGRLDPHLQFASGHLASWGKVYVWLEDVDGDGRHEIMMSRVESRRAQTWPAFPYDYVLHLPGAFAYKWDGLKYSLTWWDDGSIRQKVRPGGNVFYSPRLSQPLTIDGDLWDFRQMVVLIELERTHR